LHEHPARKQDLRDCTDRQPYGLLGHEYLSWRSNKWGTCREGLASNPGFSFGDVGNHVCDLFGSADKGLKANEQGIKTLCRRSLDETVAIIAGKGSNVISHVIAN
jgi:hypothetical protein